MPKEIYLSGLTADQLSEMIRESLRDELQQFRPARSKSETKYLTRQETARRLRISLVTLTDWVNRGKICAHKIGGRVLFRDSDVEAALNQIVPIKSR
ncbi:DNA-binding protein [Alistipes sp. AF48-12]|jgi:excisionase family DNA binding protein|uniref:helix-turn-helix domain-containing protein n=1 Tax=Alistipes sp. AF48-12 TaxID=2291998 RepID=UPI000E47A08F|nr:helix-turn-helix domain-containing protein [Alistipes sp. AF48-12]RHO68786.1 DNA-binding protein [Alistipes sp. AF48-12]